MCKADRIVGLILFLLALICVGEGWRTWDGIGGTGFFPTILGGVFACLGLGILLGKSSQKEDQPIAWPDKISRQRMIVVFAILILYAILTPWIGYPAATVLFLAVLSKTIGNKRWIFGICFGVGASAVTYIVFKIWLNMSLPTGILGI